MIFTVLTFVLKSMACTGILSAYYYLVLRNRNFHAFNRFYLLAIAVLGSVLPLMKWDIPYPAHASGSVIRVLNVVSRPFAEQEIARGTTHFVAVPLIAGVIYTLIAVAIFLPTMLSIYRLLKIKRNSRSSAINGIQLVHTQLPDAPFTFGNTVYWNDDIDTHSEPGISILAHEQVHIQQMHTADKLFFRMLTASLWFNPLLWLLQRELGMVHEFLADEGMPDNSGEMLATILLQQHLGAHYASIIQPFYCSPIKRRINMLNQNNRHERKLRMLLTVPVLAASALLFSFARTAAPSKPRQATTLLLDAGHGGNDAGAESKNGIKEKDLNLRIISELAHLAPEYGITTAMTRNDDNYISLNDRVKEVERQHAQLFLSLHVNQDVPGVPGRKGFEVNISQGNAQYENSRLLASAIAGELRYVHVSPEISQRGLHVLRSNPVPAVLIECGNIDSADDMAILQNDEKLEQLCRHILSGVVAYRNRK